MFGEACQNTCCKKDSFDTIKDFTRLNLSHLLKEILNEKQISIVDLHKILQIKGYYLNIESLYRYFNPSFKSNRSPSEDFIKIFSEVLELTDEQSELLLQFWSYFKFFKKHK